MTSNFRCSTESLQSVRTAPHSCDRLPITGGDYEKKRNRWLSKMDEMETKLVESENINAELMQIKAELNKKIVELEKGQRPLIDENRKLLGRNKVLQQEIKKLEQQLSHTKDDFFTMRDAHERVQKENCSLKGKRPNTEKLEQLNAYRQQILEYSKCINALRTAGMEKDKRYETLISKYRRLRKYVRNGELDHEFRSVNGSDCSFDDLTSINAKNEETEEEVKVHLVRIKELEGQIEELKQEVAASRDQNELLEFQVLEMEEGNRSICSTETSMLVPEKDIVLDSLDFDFCKFEADLKTLREISSLSITDQKLLANVDDNVKKLVEKYKSCTKQMNDMKAEMERLTVSGEVLLVEKEKVAKELELNDNMLKTEIKSLRDGLEQVQREKDEISAKYNILMRENEDLQEQIRPIRTELERRYEETKYRLSTALDKVHDLETELSNVKPQSSEIMTELGEMKEYNKHLEEQIGEQTHMIDLLKSKVMEQKLLTDFLNNLCKEEIIKIDDNQTSFQDSDDNRVSSLVDFLQKNYLLQAK